MPTTRVRQASETVDSQPLIKGKLSRMIRVQQSFTHDDIQRAIIFCKQEGVSSVQEVCRIALRKLTGHIQLPKQ